MGYNARMDQAACEDDLRLARAVLHAEAAAIGGIALGGSFSAAVELIEGGVAGGGAVVVSGLGKSGLIGQKLSATFASTGTPSHYLHATEAMHGDLGRIRGGDVVLMLSYTGTTQEVVNLAAVLRQDRVPMVGIVGKAGSELERIVTITLHVGDVAEACPHNLAPTASTTAMLALGDALALGVSGRRGFGVDDFKRVHPGGGLGRQLMPAVEAMRFRVGENLPLIPLGATVEAAYATAERDAQRGQLRRPGVLLIVDPSGRLAGIVTDGDLRTALIARGPGVWTGPVEAIMTRRPTTLSADALVRDAVRVVRERRFDELPIVDEEGRPLGIVDVQDLAALKVIEG